MFRSPAPRRCPSLLEKVQPSLRGGRNTGGRSGAPFLCLGAAHGRVYAGVGGRAGMAQTQWSPFSEALMIDPTAHCAIHPFPTCFARERRS